MPLTCELIQRLIMTMSKRGAISRYQRLDQDRRKRQAFSEIVGNVAPVSDDYFTTVDRAAETRYPFASPWATPRGTPKYAPGSVAEGPPV